MMLFNQLNKATAFLILLVQYKPSKFFNFQFKKKEVLKAQTKLSDYREAMTYSIFLLAIVDDSRLWMSDEIINFFEVIDMLKLF
jgi:hypothetical protein